jgi:hypothetical protein
MSALLAAVIYFSAELYKYSRGVQVLEQTLMSQAEMNEKSLDWLLHWMNYGIFKYPSRKGECGVLIPLCDSLRRLRYSKHISVRDQLNSLLCILESHVEDPDDKKCLNAPFINLIHFQNKGDQFNYYKSVILKEYYMYLKEQSCSLVTCVFSKIESVQSYDPIQKNYITYFGSYTWRDYDNVTVNGRKTKAARFSYLPTTTGLHSFEIVIPSYEYDRLEIQFDTTYYHIKVVEKEGA